MPDESKRQQEWDETVKAGLIPDETMGDVWPIAQPGTQPEDYGRATITPTAPVEVRSYQTFTLTYTAGRFGLDDTGGIKIVQRWPYDGGKLQVDDPTAKNYVSAVSSNGTALQMLVEIDGHQRPWDRSVRIIVHRGSLFEGDQIIVTFGDTSQGSPGMLMQSFCEAAYEFRVLVDACATRHFCPLSDRPALSVVPGAPAQWRAILPTLRKSGDAFHLGLRADDAWGNPTDRAEGTLYLSSNKPIDGLPDQVDYPLGEKSLRLDGLTAKDGIYQITVKDAEGHILTQSNSLVIEDGALRGFWGDLHGQSGETVGVNPIHDYFTFGRDIAFLDVMSHQANDFQIKTAFWHQINDVTRAFDEPGRLVAFPGYEWSGNSPTGGDHNVFFRHEGCDIRRSSHALLIDDSDQSMDANTTDALFDSLQEDDCVLYAHIGGRPANITQADGGHLRTALELHSDWGSFEWVMDDNFDLGYRHGVVCNSDGHKGRAGASHPGASHFGAFGGLTCFLTENLDRDGIFEAMRRRHHYGTTGARMHLEVSASFDQDATLYIRDPRLGAAESEQVKQAIMGDIVKTDQDAVSITVKLATGSPIIKVDLLCARNEIGTYYAHEETELGDRYRVTYHGAEYRGRGRQTRWVGTTALTKGNIIDFAKVNVWNHERLMAVKDGNVMEHDLVTTGNFQGFDLWVKDVEGGQIAVENDVVSTHLDLPTGLNPTLYDAGGLERAITVTRLPETLSRREMTFTQSVPVKDQGDTPIWVRVTTEDGNITWSSPIYLFKD